MIDYGKAFTFFTEDEHWLEKLGIGVGVYIASLIAALLLVSVPSFIFYFIFPWQAAGNLASMLVYYLSIVLLIGYGLRLVKNVRDGLAKPMPEWNDWGNDLIRGFKLIVVTLIWALPLLIFSIPTGIGAAMTSGVDDSSSFLGGTLLACGGCLGFLYWIFLAIVRPGYTLAYLRDEQIQSGLRFDVILPWTRRNLGPVVTVALVSVLAAVAFFVLGVVVGPILLCVGWIITIPLGIFLPMLVQSHLYGQLAREYPIDEPAPIDPDAGSGLSTPADGEFNPPAIPA